MSRERALHVGEALYRDVGAGACRDFTCLGPFRISPARLEKWAPISHELWSLWAISLLRDGLAPRSRLIPRGRDSCISRCPLSARRLSAQSGGNQIDDHSDPRNVARHSGK